MKNQLRQFFHVFFLESWKESDSLVTMLQPKFFNNVGIEGWFKVEIIKALATSEYPVEGLQREHVQIIEGGNKKTRPDLKLHNGPFVELKSYTNFDTSGLKKETLKHGTFLLFLNGLKESDRKRIDELNSEKTKLVKHEVFSDSKNDWIIGVIQPIKSPSQGLPKCISRSKRKKS